MKNTTYIFALFVLGMLSFTSCNDEIQFPDPGFDLTSDKVVDIRRDTADYYHIDINMEAPNGVDYIEIINGYDQTVQEVLEDDHGKKNFTFSYDVDLTDIVIDSTLSLVINVVDLDRRSFNKGILINVKKFSFPEITLSGGDKVGLSAPSYYLKGLVTTGLNTIDSVVLFLDDVKILTLEPDTIVSEWLIKENILIGALSEGVEYTLSIKVYDNTGQVGIKNIILVKQDLQKPYQIDYYNEYSNLFNTMSLKYNDDGELDSLIFHHFVGRDYVLVLNRNEQKLVDHVLYYYYYETYEYTYKVNLTYTYDEDNKLTEVTRSAVRHYDDGSVEDFGEETLATNIVYRENGTLESYITSAQKVTDLAYAKGFGTDEYFFAEFFSTDFSNVKSLYRQKRVDFEPIFMPTYVEGLPPFIFTSNIYDDIYKDLLLYQYVYTGNEYTNPENTTSSPFSYSYTTDASGRIATYTRSEPWYSTYKNYIYTFYYE